MESESLGAGSVFFRVLKCSQCATNVAKIRLKTLRINSSTERSRDKETK